MLHFHIPIFSKFSCIFTPFSQFFYILQFFQSKKCFFTFVTFDYIFSFFIVLTFFAKIFHFYGVFNAIKNHSVAKTGRVADTRGKHSPQ